MLREFSSSTLLLICFASTIFTKAINVQNITKRPGVGGYHIRIGTFITGKTDKWVLDAVRMSIKNYASLPKTNETCVIKNTFFVGRQGKFDGQLEEENSEISKGDVLQLPFTENMNNGKSLVWLQHAVKRYPKADFIVKRDTDTAINYTMLCSALQKANPSNNVYFGKQLKMIVFFWYI